MTVWGLAQAVWPQVLPYLLDCFITENIGPWSSRRWNRKERKVFIDTKYLPPLVLRHYTYVISINAYLTLREIITLILQLRGQVLNEVAGYGHTISTMGSDLKQSPFSPRVQGFPFQVWTCSQTAGIRRVRMDPMWAERARETFLTIKITAFQFMWHSWAQLEDSN